MSDFYCYAPNDMLCQCGAELKQLPNNDWLCDSCGAEYTPFDDKPLGKERVKQTLDDGFIFEATYDEKTVKAEKHQSLYCVSELNHDELLPKTIGWFDFIDMWLYLIFEDHFFVKAW